jgi:IS1 family transposase
MVNMNRLDASRQVQVVKCLCDGMSIRSTIRLTGVAKNTIVKLLCEMGCACASHHHRSVRNLAVRRLQCDEIWSFVGAKKKNATPAQEQEEWGDVWTWTAIDADTKLCVTYLVGDRGKHSAFAFMEDCAPRIVGRFQITTDQHKPYLAVVEKAFGGAADYAHLQKIYGAPEPTEARYSPASCIGGEIETVTGVPDPKHVSTSYVERQNLSLRISMRSFTRLTKAFSKKVENHGHAVALYFAYYNFCRIHKTPHITPAMEAGLTNHVWSVEELISLLPKEEAKRRGPYKKQISN